MKCQCKGFKLFPKVFSIKELVSMYLSHFCGLLKIICEWLQFWKKLEDTVELEMYIMGRIDCKIHLLGRREWKLLLREFFSVHCGKRGTDRRIVRIGLFSQENQ